MLSVIDRQGNYQECIIPSGAPSNVMEILKSFGYKMRATCGGMGLCADCHCSIQEGYSKLPPLTDQEADTLDILPNAKPTSRLACQIRTGQYLDQITLKLLGADHH